MNIILLTVKRMLLLKTGYKSLITASFHFETKSNLLHTIIEGVNKEGVLDKHESKLTGDAHASELRTLFVARAGEIKGDVHAVDVNIDYLNAMQECKVYFENETGKHVKNFTL